MDRFFLLAGCLLCLPFLGGCLYCAYPRIDYTPRVKLDSTSQDVHAFRADFTKQIVVVTGGLMMHSRENLWKPEEHVETQRLCELPLTSRNEVPAQVRPSLAYGFVLPILIFNALTHTNHSLAVWLYRPGYELAEIKSWEKIDQVNWKPVASLESQEKALDKLFWNLWGTSSTSAERRNTLLFVADEYERLAAISPCENQKARLVGAAIMIRMEVNSWDQFDQAAWKPIGDLNGREKVLDKLFRTLQSIKSTASERPKMLLLVADEYELLAAISPCEDQQARLVGAAGLLQNLAKK